MPTLQNLPSDLGNAEFMSPVVGQAMMNQVGLANQFNQQGMEQNSADLQAKNLENQFTLQNMPTKLQQSQANLASTLGLNQQQDFTNRLNAGSEQEQLLAKRQEMLMKASTAELTSLSNKGQQMMLQGAQIGDDAMVAKGRKMMDSSWEAIQTKQKQDAEQKKAETSGFSKEEVARITQGGANDRNIRDNETRIAVANAKNNKANDLFANVTSGKVSPDKAAVQFSTLAMFEQDPEQAAKYQKAAAAMDIMSQKQKAAQGGKIDMGEFVKVNPFTSNAGEMPTGVTRPQAPAPQQAVPTSSGEGSPASVVAAAQRELAAINKQLPNVTDAASKNMLQEQARMLQNTIDRGGRGQAVPDATSPPVATSVVRMRKPDGTLMNVPAANAEKAAAAGWKKE